MAWVILGSLFLLRAAAAQEQYQEKYRPQFHFSPAKGWIGDPDGLVFAEGKYHLFWWGHAVSEDLIHWRELPYPMKGGDGSFSYFSGSVVVDKRNTSGFGESSMIAVYTRHIPGDKLPETQALSISSDGITFQYYEHNPVLDVGKIFFRDPQVFWYAPEAKWVMVVALPDVHRIHLYQSKDLKSWNFLSEFGELGAQNAFWECPDLFELPVDGNPNETKWVMLIGRGPNRVQYFLGSFDGKAFEADEKTVGYLLKGEGLQGELFAGFEEPDFGGWKATGVAFGQQPTGSKSVIHLGSNFAQSLNAGPESTGRLESPAFTISHSAINFLIAGGSHPGRACINLIVDGKTLRTATGDNSDILKWNGWKVDELIGKQARLQIVDDAPDGERPYIAVDHIMFSNALRDENLEHALWLDYGTDFYAARTWRDIDQASNRTVFLGWMGNWAYANEVPTKWGKGFESVPREIGLKRFGEGIRIVQKPVPELRKLRGAGAQFADRVIEGIQSIAEFNPTRNTYELEVVWDVRTAGTFGLNLLVGEGRKLAITYDPKTSNLTLDRTRCSDHLADAEFTRKFATKMHAAVEPENNQLRLQILVDQSSIELFVNHGKTVLSALTFPGESQTGIELFSKGGQATVLTFRAWELSSIWPVTPPQTEF